jgi:hypothetical protein
MPETIPNDASLKEQFDLLYANLKYYHDSSIDSAFKVAGFLIIVGGWLITSKDARAFLASSNLFRLTAVTVILVIAAFYTLIAMRVMWHSRLTFNRLKELEYIPTAQFQEMLIRPSVIIPFILVNSVISVAICLCILRLS